MTSFFFNSEAKNDILMFYDSVSASSLMFVIQSSEMTSVTMYNVNLNILVSNRYEYKPKPHVSDDIIESAYQGWPLKYSVLRSESAPIFTFKVHAELDTGAEKIYIDYEQTSLGDECEFLNYIAQTVTPKEAA